jgi:iron complex transport system substrate-binding protein
VLVREAVTELGLDCEVLTTDPHHLTDVFEDVTRLGRVLGREDRAAALRERLERRVERVRAPAGGPRPRTLVLDWTEPPMVAGHWVPGMVDLVGGEYGMADPGAHSGPREWSDVLAYDPEVLVVAPCGFELEQTFEHLDTLTDQPGWADVTAVREGRAYAMDGHGHVNRPGLRLVDTLEAFAAVCRPEAFDPPSGELVRPLVRSTA